MSGRFPSRVPRPAKPAAGHVDPLFAECARINAATLSELNESGVKRVLATVAQVSVWTGESLPYLLVSAVGLVKIRVDLSPAECRHLAKILRRVAAGPGRAQ